MTTPRILTTENAKPLFHRVSDEPPKIYQSWLIYGGAKTGKTWFAGTAGTRALFISIGNGDATIKSPGFKKVVGADPIFHVIKENTDKYGICKEPTAFNAVQEYIEYALDNFADEFDAVIVDDATALGDYALWKAVKYNFDQGGKSKTWEAMQRTHVFTPVVQDFGTQMNIMDQFVLQAIQGCFNYNKHFIITAHTRETYIKRQGAQIGEPKELKSITPAFIGETFPDYISGHFDNVIKMEAVGGGSNVVYRALTAGDEKITAGMRNAGLFETAERFPNLSEFFERIKKGELHKNFRSNR